MKEHDKEKANFKISVTCNLTFLKTILKSNLDSCVALFGARQYGVTTRKNSCEKYPHTLILRGLRVLGQGLNQSARIFFTRVFSGCYAILTSPKEGETAVYGYDPALF